MGIEYVLLDDKSLEAYELGKGPWSDVDLTSRASIAAAFEGFAVMETYKEEIAAEILLFLEKHPRARLADDFWLG